MIRCIDRDDNGTVDNTEYTAADGELTDTIFDSTNTLWFATTAILQHRPSQLIQKNLKALFMHS